MPIIKNQKIDVQYRDRQTDRLVKEKIQSEKELRFLYETSVGFQVLNRCFNNSAFCKIYGKLKDTAGSRQKILPFVQQHEINLDEIELSIDQYRSFNHFFTRRLKPEARPFVKHPSVFCSPADSKLLIFNNIQAKTTLKVKGIVLSVVELLNDSIAAQRYQGGTALVFRLAPYDYHRFHFPVTGIAQESRLISGRYDSVNPIALNQVPDVFCRNQRSVTTIETSNFGQITMVEVGALTVGSIVQTYQPNHVKKGDEKGYFQYGGSTIIILLEAVKIVLDADLIRDSEQCLEVHVLAGSQIGKQA
jgi:phosphatidylserine decarboxylase